MLFNSVIFFKFFLVVFCLYWSLYKFKDLQNLLLLGSSYFFYAWWNPYFCILLLFSSTLGYFTGVLIEDAGERRKKTVLIGATIIHLGILGWFKYCNFLIGNINSLFSITGIQHHLPHENIILPLAISFFTFHIIGYTIDVYRKDFPAARDYINFIAHIAFFPQLVAGPIERGGHLLPQFRNKRTFSTDMIVSGMRQALWGFFKKLAIADMVALQVDYIFKNHADLNGSTLLLGIFMFSIQIYCDFSGYTDIALGIARMLGIELLTNFKYPYFATSITEFWHRWHISLSSWFRDYIYIPLGGSRVKRIRFFFNIFIVFMLSGLWHGAKWTFVIWGAFHGIVSILNNILSKFIKAPSNKLMIGLQMFSTFVTVTMAWVFFRALSVKEAWSIITGIFTKGIADLPSIQQTGLKGLACALILFVVEWFQRDKLFGLDVRKMHYTIRWTAYVVLIVLIFSSDSLNKQHEFIYFQF